MKKYLRLTAALVCLSLLFLLTGCQDSKMFSPSASSTWGELCKQFQPEWYKELPQEMQQKCEELLLLQAPSQGSGEEFMEYTEVLSLTKLTEAEQEAKGYPLLVKDGRELYDQQGSNELGFGELTLNLMVKKTKADFESSLSSILNDQSTMDFAVMVAISDKDTGKYFAVQADSFSMSTDTNGIVGTFENLKSDHLYQVQVLALAKTEGGSLTSEPLYVTKTLKTL